ncbi:MAG: hypothetical protein ACLFSM_08005 [Thermoplasmata archaeon]
MNYELLVDHWLSIIAIVGMITLLAIGWTLGSNRSGKSKIIDDTKEDDEVSGERCPLKNYDLKKCPKCGERTLRVYSDGSVECEECGFSIKDAKMF